MPAKTGKTESFFLIEPANPEASAGFFRKIFHQLDLDFLDLQKSLSLVNEEMINFPVQLVNLHFCVEVYLVIMFGIHPVSFFLTVLAHDNDRSLYCGQG
jgi:hypothetical protein